MIQTYLINKLPLEIIDIIFEFIDIDLTHLQTQIENINDTRLSKIILRKQEIVPMNDLINRDGIYFFNDSNLYYFLPMENKTICNFVWIEMIWITFLLLDYEYSLVNLNVPKNVIVIDTYMRKIEPIIQSKYSKSEKKHLFLYLIGHHKTYFPKLKYIEITAQSRRDFINECDITSYFN